MKHRKMMILMTLLVISRLSFCGVIVQYFESRWQTIEHRMPDVFMAGYGSFWLPPNGVADSGGYSVGYDVFDRFNLGTPYWQSLYGTEEQYLQLVKQSHLAGKLVYADIILNHNGFSDASRTDFVVNGDYPGFVCSLDSDVDGDFHGAYDTGDWYERTSGLIDIAQEKNHLFIRHPVEENDANIPYETPTSENRRFYQDSDPAPGDVTTPSGFNLTNPYGGDAYQENATGLLLRYLQWMVEVVGVDGFRLDAQKHIPPWFFNDMYDGALKDKGAKDFYGNASTPFSFGEIYDSSFDLLDDYIRKDGYGNRDVLDFPLYFKMKDIFSGSGYGNLGDLSSASIDGVDGDANDGTRGVHFVSNHDGSITAPGAQNLAYAYVLTRPGYPLVYFNALEFGTDRDFPIEGRGDALGGRYGDTITKLVDIHNEYASGTMNIRYSSNDIYVYERSKSLVVALCDRKDNGYQEVTVYVDFDPGTVLHELTGHWVDNSDVAETVTVDSNWQITIKIPHDPYDKGYVMYGIKNPQGELSLNETNGEIAADPDTYSNAKQRYTSVPVVIGDSVTVTLQTNDTVSEDNALIRLDGGVNLSGDDLDIKDGQFAGFEQFSSRSARAEGGSGTYAQVIDTSSLSDGYHYITVVAFTPRTSGSPATFNTFRKVIYVDRTVPEVNVVYPELNESNYQIDSSDYVLKYETPDGTPNSMHIFFDGDAASDTAADYVSQCSGSNQVNWLDRFSWEYSWTDIQPGYHTVALVMFKPSGNVYLKKFTNYFSTLPNPPMDLGYDGNLSETATTFYTLPSAIGTSTFQNIVVQIDETSGISFPDDYEVTLTIDDTHVYEAVSYQESYKNQYGVLFNWDQNTTDQYQEFRFHWNGYTRGTHTFVAKAKLKNQTSQENIRTKQMTVSDETPAPAVEITSPADTGQVGIHVNVSATLDIYSTSLVAYFNQPSESLRQVFLLDDVQNYSGFNASTGQIQFSFNLDSPHTDVSEGFQASEGANKLTLRVGSGPSLSGIENSDEVDVVFSPASAGNWTMYQ